MISNTFFLSQTKYNSSIILKGKYQLKDNQKMVLRKYQFQYSVYLRLESGTFLILLLKQVPVFCWASFWSFLAFISSVMKAYIAPMAWLIIKGGLIIAVLIFSKSSICISFSGDRHFWVGEEGTNRWMSWICKNGKKVLLHLHSKSVNSTQDVVL